MALANYWDKLQAHHSATPLTYADLFQDTALPMVWKISDNPSLSKIKIYKKYPNTD